MREALIDARRGDLFGGCDGLIPAQPPKEALEKRRREANADHDHTVANPAKGEQPAERTLPKRGYRPGRKSKQRQQRGK